MAIIKDFQESRHLLASYAGTALILWVVCRIVYLRYFHPLAHIPGPFLASITELYRFYYDYIKNGSYYLQFEGFQSKYGENVVEVTIDQGTDGQPSRRQGRSHASPQTRFSSRTRRTTIKSIA